MPNERVCLTNECAFAWLTEVDVEGSPNYICPQCGDDAQKSCDSYQSAGNCEKGSKECDDCDTFSYCSAGCGVDLINIHCVITECVKLPGAPCSADVGKVRERLALMRRLAEDTEGGCDPRTGCACRACPYEAAEGEYDDDAYCPVFVCIVGQLSDYDPRDGAIRLAERLLEFLTSEDVPPTSP